MAWNGAAESACVVFENVICGASYHLPRSRPTKHGSKPCHLPIQRAATWAESAPLLSPPWGSAQRWPRCPSSRMRIREARLVRAGQPMAVPPLGPPPENGAALPPGHRTGSRGGAAEADGRQVADSALSPRVTAADPSDASPALRDPRMPGALTGDKLRRHFRRFRPNPSSPTPSFAPDHAVAFPAAAIAGARPAASAAAIGPSPRRRPHRRRRYRWRRSGRTPGLSTLSARQEMAGRRG